MTDVLEHSEEAHHAPHLQLERRRDLPRREHILNLADEFAMQLKAKLRQGYPAGKDKVDSCLAVIDGLTSTFRSIRI